MITGMDRLVAAVKGEECDRIPVFCNIFDQGAKELGMPINEYYSKGEHVAEGQILLQKKYGYDNAWGLFYVGKSAEILGCQEILYPEDGSPNVADFVIKSYDDIEKLQIPDDVENHPEFAEQLKCLQLLKNEVGGKNPIVAYLTSSMCLPAILMGMDKWFELLFTGPEDVRDALLEKCHDFFVKETTAYRNAGADALVYSNPFGSTDTVPMKYFMEHSLPWIEKDIKAVGSEGMVYYCGMSRFNKVIDTIFKKTNITCYYLSPLDDVAEGKNNVAGRGLTCGVINDCKLLEWSKEEIRNEVKRLIEAGMPGGKFVFGASATLYQTPEEKIRAMLEAAYEFGSYKK